MHLLKIPFIEPYPPPRETTLALILSVDSFFYSFFFVEGNIIKWKYKTSNNSESTEQFFSSFASPEIDSVPIVLLKPSPPAKRSLCIEINHIILTTYGAL